MKKIISACFMFMFLLAVVAGCPSKPGDSKPGGGGSTPVDFNESDGGGDSMTSSDDYSAK